MNRHIPLRFSKMKTLVVFSALFAVVTSASVSTEDAALENNPAYGYMSKVGVPLAEKIRKAEEQSTLDGLENDVKTSLKIIDGTAARLGEIPYQAGLISDLKDFAKSVCGGSLLSTKRVLTAAHCWYDGVDQAFQMTVVLGSVKLYSGGVRIEAIKVVTHNQWTPQRRLNDIAMIYLPYAVTFSNTIQPIALPSGREIQESFVGYKVIASGFGSTYDGELAHARTYLSYVQLQVISNERCAELIKGVDNSKICTQGINTKNTCRGDSGGPVAFFRNKKPILIGVNSFGAQSCLIGLPTGYTRVTYYINWINSQLQYATGTIQ